MSEIDKICRNFAEQIWEAIPAYDDPLHKEEEINDFEKAIRDNTILPEMVELFKSQTAFMASLVYAIINQNLQESVPTIKTLLDANKGLGAKCMSILTKAKGGNDG